MSNDRTVRAAIYCRVSSDNQDVENSINAQEYECRDFCERQGWQLPEEFVFIEPEAVSAKDENRPAFMQMVSLAKQKNPPFDVIVVNTRSRFMRHREKATIYTEMLRRNGVRVISVKEPTEDSPFGRAMEGIIDIFAEVQREQIAIETRRGMEENARNGYSIGGLAYGYRRKVDKIVQRGYRESAKVLWEPDPVTAPVVQRIFDMYTRLGLGNKQICITLNSEKVAGPGGGLWYPSTIRDLVSNESYLGRRIANRHYPRSSRQRHRIRPRDEWIIVENAHQPLVSMEVWEQAQAVRESRSRKKFAPTSARAFLLTGLIVCDKCRKPVTGNSTTRILSDGTTKSYRKYRCRGSSAGVCRWRSIDADALEGAVTRLLSMELATPAVLHEVSLAPPAAEPKSPVEDLRAELADVNKRIMRIISALETSDTPATDLMDRLKQLQSRKEQLQERLQVEVKSARQRVRAPIDMDALRDFGNTIERLEITERKELLGLLIDGITLDLEQQVGRMVLRGGKSVPVNWR